MKSLLLLVALIILSANTHARKPAVEDFVGVEPETYKVTPPGTEVLFDFNQQVQSIQQPAVETQSPWFGVGAIAAFITLPVLLWFGLTRKMPAADESYPAIMAQKTEPNVHHLEDYRQEEDEEDKKAS
jgi:hypothetical protein